jgi:glycerol uptake facilitator-like aquaporin
MSVDPSRRLLAGAIGTGILVMLGAGSVVAALKFGGGELDYAGLGMVAIMFGLEAIGTIGGGGDTFGGDLPAYVIGPLLGGAAAAFAFDAVARVCRARAGAGDAGRHRGAARRAGRAAGGHHAGSGREASGSASLNTTQREERYG